MACRRRWTRRCLPSLNGAACTRAPPAGEHKISIGIAVLAIMERMAFPPNFLHGSPDAVKSNLAQCADRMFVRLSMWDVADPEQLEAPMPPAMHLLHHRISLDQWKSHPDLQVLRKEAVAAIQRKRGAIFTPEDLLRQDYDTLPACLAPRRELTEAVGAHHG